MRVKGPATAAVDRIVAEVIAPALKGRGFKRRGRLWTHSSDAADRGLSVQRSRFNYGDVARFTLNVRFAFFEVGHERFVAGRPGADLAGPRARIGPYIAGHDQWWELSDARSGPAVDAFVRAFANDWDDLVLPLVDSADDPRRFCTRLTDHGPLSAVFIAFDHAQQLGEPDLATAAFDRALELARRLEPSPQHLEARVQVVAGVRSAPSRRHGLYDAWERVTAMAQRSGRQLEGADYERAVDALLWAADAAASDTAGMTAYAARLGLAFAKLDLTSDAVCKRRDRLEQMISSEVPTRPRSTS